MSSIALDFFLLIVFNLELSLDGLSVRASVGAMYGSSGETNNTLDGRIVLESTPTLASGCMYERNAKNKGLAKIFLGLRSNSS